ncbi:unnamed protein product [Ilex paraguariensis]|uniref:Uncharacterized protein n=1 Tax=Ilex paraguariensis TaxID=185542 RepID=A0ABC8RAE1_9AQUA
MKCCIMSEQSLELKKREPGRVNQKAEECRPQYDKKFHHNIVILVLQGSIVASLIQNGIAHGSELSGFSWINQN